MTTTSMIDGAAPQAERELREHIAEITGGNVAGARINGHGIVAALAKPDGWQTAMALADRCGPRDTAWWASPLGVLVSRALEATPDDAHPGLSREEIGVILGISRAGVGAAIDSPDSGLTIVPASRTRKPWRWTVGSVHRYAAYSRVYRSGDRTAAAALRPTLTRKTS